MCAWLLSAATRGRRHLSSLWEESTSWSLGWEGGRCHKRLVQTTYCSDHTEKAWAGGQSIQRADYRKMIVFCVFREKQHANLKATLPVFRDRWHLLIERTAAVLSGKGNTTMEKLGFGFLFPSLISTAPRENYTLWRAVVIFLLLFSYHPPTPPASTECRQSSRFS